MREYVIVCVYVYVGSVGSRVCLKCVYPCRVCSPDCVCVCVFVCVCLRRRYSRRSRNNEYERGGQKEIE